MVTMNNAADAENVERLPHIAGGSFFAGMRGEEKTGVTRVAKHVLELARRIAGFRRIEPDTDDLIPKRQRRIQGLLRVRLGEMAQKAHDQARANAVLPLGIGDGAGK